MLARDGKECQLACLVTAQTLNGCGVKERPTLGSRVGRSHPGGLWNLKLCSKRAKTRKNSILANDSPKQPRRPAEKGRKGSAVGGTKSLSLLRNLWGLKLLGASQISGSWWRDHKLINTVVPFGMWHPCRFVSTVLLWTAKGPPVMRRFSVIVASRSGRLFLSSSKKSVVLYHCILFCLYPVLPWIFVFFKYKNRVGLIFSTSCKRVLFKA